MAVKEILEYGQLTAANAYESLFNLNDEKSFFMKAGTFKVQPGTKLPVIAQNQRRYGGGRQVAETTENGRIEWVAGVAGKSQQECLEKVEKLLAQLEANPYREFIKWQLPGATQPTLFEVRGSASWIPEYEWAMFEGAELFLFTVTIPIAPLALGLPVKQYEKAGLTLPETLSIGTVPGDAPAKAEVLIETGSNLEELIKTLREPEGIAVDGTFIYWTDHEKGFIGRAKLNGTVVEKEFINTGGKPVGIAVDAGHIYWADTLNNRIGRATIAGATIEATWLTASVYGPFGLAVDASHIYWGTATNGSVSRAPIAGGAVEATWISNVHAYEGIAITSTHVYWVNPVEHTIGRAAIGGGTIEKEWLSVPNIGSWVAANSEALFFTTYPGVAVGRCTLAGSALLETWQPTTAVAGGVAASSEFVYRGNSGVSPAGVIFRMSAAAPPVFALIATGSKPKAGLGTAPFGIINATAHSRSVNWYPTARSGTRSGTVLISTGYMGEAAFEVDPATLAPDAFSGELAVELWARMLVSPGLGSAIVTASAQPQDFSFGASRYTDEWGSSGRPLTIPSAEGGEDWRLTRLGTLHLLVNPLAPRLWVLNVRGVSTGEGLWGLDYLLLVPVLQRACSPSGKVQNSTYPAFISTGAAVVKTIHSDLSGAIAKPGQNGHPDRGLGGQLLEIPPGEAEMLVKLSSLVPDDPTLSGASEVLSHTAKVTVWVTPRWFLTRLV